MLSICSFVCLSVCLSPNCVHKNAILSKTKQFSYSLYWRPIGSPTSAFQRTYSRTPKIQDGGRPPTWKWSNRYISAKNHLILVYFVQNSGFGTRWQSMTKYKLKMADSRHIENCFLAIIKWNFVWRSSFSQNFDNGTDTRVPQNTFLVFLMQFGLRQAAPFRIVSDTLVSLLYNSQTWKYINIFVFIYITHCNSSIEKNGH